MKDLILIHGLLKSDKYLILAEKYFSRLGYKCHLISYPYKSGNISYLLDYTYDKYKQLKIPKNKKIYIFGHSLGGLIARGIAYKDRDIYDFIVVQAGSPNKGTIVADKVSKIKGIEKIVGDIIFDLQAENNHLTDLLGAVEGYTLGSIIGTTKFGILSFLLNTKTTSDGYVTEDSAKAENALDIIYININHTFLPYSKRVFFQADYFFKNKKFYHK